MLETLAQRIRQAWMHDRRPLPYDVPEQRELYDIALRTAGGGFPTPEDDELVRRVLYRPAPTS